MKAAFQRFKIQYVNKRVVKSSNPRYIKENGNKKLGYKKRQITTADIGGRKQNGSNYKKIDKDKNQTDDLATMKNCSVNRSKSFKQQCNNEIREQIDYVQNKVGCYNHQRQYRVFQEKCIEILAKKQNYSRVSIPRNFNSNILHNRGLLLPQKDFHKTIDKANTVQQMMNNIIDKFKNQSKIRYLKDKNQDGQQIKNQAFLTTNKKNVLNPQKKINKSQRRYQKHSENEIFQTLRLSEYKGNSSNQLNAKTSQTKKVQRRINQHSTSAIKYSHVWKQIPEITGVRVNKNLFKNKNSDLNPIVCTSISLNESIQLKKSLFSFEKSKIESPSKPLEAKRKIIHLNKPYSKIRFMKFTKNVSDDQYNKKIKAFLDFLFKVNFSNNIYVNLQLSAIQETIIYHKYKVYVGQGNNCNLIKSLLKRREWIQIVDNQNEQNINFYWTQNRIKAIHQKQQTCKTYKNQKVNSNHNRRRSSINLHDTIEQNTKIMSLKKSENVEEYIFKDGYQIPFQKEYKSRIITNHIPGNYVIGSKKNLFKSMFTYYSEILKKNPFTVIPKTYHIKSIDDPEFRRFVTENKNENDKLWIVKPGENTNRGNGIKLKQFYKIQSLLKQKVRHSNGHLQTYIVQSYINKPFLYNGRKFDIRHYMMITSVNGILKAYWYRDGYIRTSSQLYDLDDHENQFVHLTNDAIQQKSESYSKYQEANKLSYSDFQRYLDHNHTNKCYYFENVIKQMKNIILDVVKASYLNLDKERRQDNFQLFGFDFMLDRELKPYLIEINFNPCLVVNCNVLSRIIPPLIENTFRVGLDPLLPPRNHLAVNKRNNLSQNYLKNLRYEVIFDEAVMEIDIKNKPELEDSQDEQEEYCDNGKEVADNFII